MQTGDAGKSSQMDDWKQIDAEVAQAFKSGAVLTESRKTLERSIAALCGRTYEFEREQQPMLQRLEVIKHLVVVRLAEESEKRRDDQAAVSSQKMQRHNFLTRWIAVIGIIISAVAAVANWLKPAVQVKYQIPPAPVVTTPAKGTAMPLPALPEQKHP